MITVSCLTLPSHDFEQLRTEARQQGYDFLDTTVTEWESGINRFDGPGERFLGWWEREALVATGALTRDPFAGLAEVGRIRRVYVRADRRGQGLGTAVVRHLLAEARKTFRRVRLRAANDRAAQLYERLGFHVLEDANATHELRF